MPFCGYSFNSDRAPEPVAAPPVFILTAITAEAWAVRKAVAGMASPPPVFPIGIRAVRPQPNLKGVELVIMAGLAGGLDPTLKIGDVVLDDPAGLIDPALPLHRGRIHTSAELLTTAAAKAELFRFSGALAVDMEQAIAFSWAKKVGAACVGVRAISDTADHALDPGLLSIVDELGETRPLALMGALLRRPSRMRSLMQLGRNVAIAKARLGEAVKQAVQAWRDRSRAAGVNP